MPGPISPDDLKDAKHIPEEVFEVFNDLIRRASNGVVKQKDVVAAIVQKMGVASERVYREGWLNVEDAYRAKGWDVDYDKPGYNETYDATFRFTASPKRGQP